MWALSLLGRWPVLPQLISIGTTHRPVPHPHPRRPLLPYPLLSLLCRASYLGCSQAGSSTGPMGRRLQALHADREGTPARSAGGEAGRPGAEGRGLSSRSNLPKKKKKKKFLKFLRRREPAAPPLARRGAAGARGWAGLAGALTHPSPKLRCTRLLTRLPNLCVETPLPPRRN